MNKNLDIKMQQWYVKNVIWAGNKETNKSSRRGRIPLAIVNHMSTGSKESCISWFTSKNNTNSSAHFLVGIDGSIYQFVNIEENAWCNGLTRGIKAATSELVNEQFKKGSKNVNRFTVSIEHEGGMEDKGDLSPAQLKATIELHDYIIEYVKAKYNHSIISDRKHIIGHCEINKIDKINCPGPRFPYYSILQGLGNNVTDLPFIDIEDHWAKDFILKATELKIVSGNGQNKNFFPDSKMTRAEAVTLIMNLYYNLIETMEEKIKESTHKEISDIFEEINKSLDEE